MNELDTFVNDIVKVLDKDGILVIQQNYLVGMLIKNALDNIVHEHLTYFSLLSLEPLLKRHGLEIFDVKLTDVNGGSFRTLICYKGKRKIDSSVKDLRNTEILMNLNNKQTYIAWGKKVLGIIKDLHDFIEEEVQKGKKVYLLAASTRGNSLLQAAHLDSSLIMGASERNPDKWGKKIASVNILIVSEEEARKAKPDYFLILPWFFAKEIIAREKDYLMKGGKLILPLPELKIISKEDL
ncbi:MAG: methyltransferase C-terminal domain-containing protein [Nanoarchaeota archaeon]